MAAALAIARQGFDVKVLEQAPEIGAGVQLGPFAAFDALGIGERAWGRAVYTARMDLLDAIDESVVCSVPFGEAFRRRLGYPYAVFAGPTCTTRRSKACTRPIASRFRRARASSAWRGWC